MSELYETWLRLSCHELIILKKFHENRKNNEDFSQWPMFAHVSISFYSDFKMQFVVSCFFLEDTGSQMQLYAFFRDDTADAA